ncbi:MAG: response regulator [Chitinivibrionales bacterium]
MVSSVHQKSILLVDDEPAILLAFKKVLQSPTVGVDTAQTVDEAKQSIDNNGYLGVIADLRLTGATVMDGFEVISYVKEKQPSAFIIVITAYGDNQTKEKIYTLGADYYFEKPISPKKIKDVLESLGTYS